MKVAHVVNYAPSLSGMYGTVRDLVREERKRSINAQVIDDVAATHLYGTDDITPVSPAFGDEADIICWHHAMFESWFNEPHRNIVLFLHGTPEFNLWTELNGGDRALSLIIGLANMKIPKAIVTMWPRHVPIWESILNTKVQYVQPWTNLNDWNITRRPPDPNVIKIGMMDYWRLTREPFGLFMAIDWLKKHTDKRVQVNVWGLTEMPNKTWLAAIQWLIEDGTVVLRGNTKNPKEDIYDENDIILTMSSEETRVVREAYSMGVPIISGFHGMQFTKYCQNTLYPDVFGKEILRCHDDLCNNTDQIRTELRQYAEKNFNIETSTDQVLNIFGGVLNKFGSVNHPIIPKSANGVRLVHPVKETMDIIEDKFKSKEPFTFLRFGDGDYLIMDGQNDSYHNGSEELKNELIESFSIKDPNYVVSSVAGMVNEGKMRNGLFASFSYDKHLVEVVQKYRPDETLCNAIAVAYQSVFEPHWFIEFLDKYIRNQNILFIGNKSTCENVLVQKTLNFTNYIELPERDAYYSLNENYELIKNKIEELQPTLVIAACGMATRIIAKRLFNDGVKVTYFDIGSIVDCLANNSTRTWIRMVGEDYRKNYEIAYFDRHVDIVTLTYKNEEVTKRCFESIKDNTSNYNMYWVDNGSGPESLADVRPVAETLENCELTMSDKNEGFSKGCNKALKKIMDKSKSKYILFLNNDVIVPKDWLEHMISSLEISGYDAIAPLTSENNPHSLDAIRPIVSDLPFFGDEDDVDKRSEVLWDKYGSKAFQCSNMISFFCCLVKREVVEKVGMLDENIFAYGEDNDYCKRMTMEGFKFGLALGCYVHHDHHSTSNLIYGHKWVEQKKREAGWYLEKKYSTKKSAPASK